MEFPKVMSQKFTSKAIILLILAVILSMNQETPAQKKPVRKPAPTREVKAVPPEVSYTISMSKPWTHLLEVEMSVKWVQMPEKTELKLPVWTPGSYLIREYSRHVQNFSATDASGNALPWTKSSKNTWQIDTKGTKEIVAKYYVYSNELTVRTNEVNDEHAFWNTTAALFFVKGHLAIPSTVKVNPYANWRVATGLPAVAGQPNTFTAKNYDILYDSPFEVSDFKEYKFDVQGKAHRFIVTGEGNYDLKKLAADTAKIVEESYKVFGEFGYDEDYTFIVNTRGGGGLEHLNSTALQTNRFGFKPDSRYKNFLGLVAHEYFHAWNVKRIRPDALGPFDYENENYTKLLWVAEGGTEYYSNLLMLRAGLITEKEFLAARATGISQLQTRPGRFETSLESASFDAWIKYYRPDENAINNQISYYDKGEIVNMMLDITIRTASGGTKSLDDVMRYLHTEYFKKGRNFTPQDFQKTAETMAGKSLDDFFAKYVRGTAEIDYNEIVKGIGLQLNAKDSQSGRSYAGGDGSIRSLPLVGADVAEVNGVLTIRTIPAGTAAYDQGLNTGDQIVAIDGYRANLTFIQSYLSERKSNDKIKLTIFRFDKLRDVAFTLGSDGRKDYDFAPVTQPTEDQKRLYKQYLNANL